jgi:hypothetical protein
MDSHRLQDTRSQRKENVMRDIMGTIKADASLGTLAVSLEKAALVGMVP